MFKKFVPIFLIAAILAAQVVGRCAHAHLTADGGAMVAHFHLGGHDDSEHDHGHDHGHSHQGHSHHGNHSHNHHSDLPSDGGKQDNGDGQCVDNLNFNSDWLGLDDFHEPTDHNADAIYLIDDEQSFTNVRTDLPQFCDLVSVYCEILKNERPKCARLFETLHDQRPTKNPVYLLTRRILL